MNFAFMPLEGHRPDDVFMRTDQECFTYAQLAYAIKAWKNTVAHSPCASHPLQLFAQLLASWEIGHLFSLNPQAASTQMAYCGEETSLGFIFPQNEGPVLYTSGSSSRPKALVHTTESFYFSALGSVEFLKLDAKDRWWTPLRLDRIGGLMCAFRMLLCGGQVCLSERAQATGLLQHEPSWISLVPTQLMDLLRQPQAIAVLQNAKGILLGGAPTPRWLIEKAKKYQLPLLLTYGCSEAAAQITCELPQTADNQSCGVVLPYRHLEIQNGRALLSGRTLFKRYLEAPQDCQNQQVLLSDKVAWNSKSELIVQGRTDDVFLSGGQNISPSELQSKLEKLSCIQKAQVFPLPHSRLGQAIWAVVQSEQDFLEHPVLQTLPSSIRPQRLLKWPREKTQEKLSRQTLQTWAQNNRFQFQLGRTRYRAGQTPADAPLWVFLHGFMGNLDSLNSLVDELAVPVLQIELPGHGHSPWPEQLLQSPLDYLREVWCLLEGTGHNQFCFYGYSLGGRLASWLASLKPHKVVRLLLESSGFGSENTQQRQTRLQTDQKLLSSIQTAQEWELFLKNWYAQALFSNLNQNPSFPQLIKQRLQAQPSELHKVLQIFSVAHWPTAKQILTPLQCPVEYFCGAADVKYAQLGQALAAQFSHVNLHRHLDSGHALHLQAPDWLKQQIHQWTTFHSEQI